jgi:hypothetical protein
MSSMGVDKFSVSTDKIVYKDTMDETADEFDLIRFLGAGAFSNV